MIKDTITYQDLLNTVTLDRTILNHETSLCGTLKLSNIEQVTSITNDFTGIYDYDVHSPYWLISDFNDDVWELDFGKTNNKIIDWHAVKLSDGNRLASIKHRPLLNAFKYMILLPSIPQYNGGIVKKTDVIAVSVSKSIHIINMILLNHVHLDLSSKHLKLLSSDFFLAIFKTISEVGLEEGIYSYTDSFKKFLSRNINEVSDTDIEYISNRFSYTNGKTSEKLNLNQENLLKSISFLWSNGFYATQGSFVGYPNTQKIARALFSNKFICVNDINFSVFEDLRIKEPRRLTELNSVKETIERDNSLSESTMSSYFELTKTLTTINSFNNTCQLDSFKLSNLTLDRLKKVHNFKPVGRTFTLPADLIFDAMKQSIELLIRPINKIHNIINVLSSDYIKIFCTYPDSKLSKKLPSHKFRELVNEWQPNSLNNVSSETKSLGVEEVFLTGDIDYEKIRNNHSFIYLYNTMIGASCFLTGSLSARRITELLRLKPTGNLVPNGIDPWENKDINFSLRFQLQKSGIGGKNSQNTYVTRPIPQIVAKIIYNLEKFNKNLIETGLSEESNLALFNSASKINGAISRVDAKQFSQLIDLFCDYFQSKTITDENGVTYRYYIREHELRRFFALVFFWSKGSRKADSLRHFLGHTDLKHLYNYITESVTGAVLNGVKANFLASGSGSKLLSNIEDLNSALCKRFGTDTILLSTSSLASEDFLDEGVLDDDFDLNLNVNKLTAQSELESSILTLLNEDIISLEPEFFTVNNSENELITDFNFILKIKDNYDE